MNDFKLNKKLSSNIVYKEKGITLLHGDSLQLLKIYTKNIKKDNI